MGKLKIPKFLNPFNVTKFSILVTVGGVISKKLFKRARKKWEALSTDNLEMVLDYITPLDIARGAGQLLKDWLLFNNPKMNLDDAEKHLAYLISELDPKDHSPQDLALSRLLVSKVLFYMEGFNIKACRYEHYQQEAQTLLKKLPQWRHIKRQQVFQAEPFQAEDIIGTTHRMLYTLSNDKLPDFIESILSNRKLNSDKDYMKWLIALTLGLEDNEQFEQYMLQWMKEYRQFKLQQTNQQETWVNNSLSAVSGGLPSTLGMKLFKKAFLRKK